MSTPDERPHEHEYESAHAHGQTREHTPGHAEQPRGDAHDHAHPHGPLGALRHLFVPHTHDAADAIDDAMEASQAGVRALRISMLVLLGTTLLQGVVVVVTQSVALFADTVHNLSDALTAVPLLVAFVVARRAPSRRYTYGYGRGEDLAGLGIVVVVLLSAVVAAWQSVDRLLHPHPVSQLGWLAVAGVIGFAGNETVAVYRIRVGRRIGSAALVADGVHARTDGLTSLAVVLGAAGVGLGLPLADPIVGLLISATILVLLIGTVRSIGRRLLDGVEPSLLDTARHAILHVDGIHEVRALRLRWVGHRLQGDATVVVGDVPLSQADAIAAEAERQAAAHLHAVDVFRVRTTAGALH